MKEYSNKEQLCFDDILLVPQHSTIESRSQVNLSTAIGRGPNGYGMSIPVIAAPMDTVCEYEMAIKLRQLGGLGMIHRYNTIEQQATEARIVSAHNSVTGAAIGATGDFIERAWELKRSGVNLLLIDTANGHHQNAIDAIKKLRNAFGYSIHIMAGNVSTWHGFGELAEAGADSIRVGIGGGSMCTTRIVTGHGMPTLASIMDITPIKERHYPNVSIIADGGIRNSGDAAKAIAAGADAVMLGSMLAGTNESPGSVIINENGKFKSFRGMASREAQYEGRGSVSVVEGVSTLIPYKGSLESVLEEFSGGLRSALSYSGAQNIKEFKEKAEYIKVTHSSLGESNPHGKKN